MWTAYTKQWCLTQTKGDQSTIIKPLYVEKKCALLILCGCTPLPSFSDILKECVDVDIIVWCIFCHFVGIIRRESLHNFLEEPRTLKLGFLFRFRHVWGVSGLEQEGELCRSVAGERTRLKVNRSNSGSNLGLTRWWTRNARQGWKIQRKRLCRSRMPLLTRLAKATVE